MQSAIWKIVSAVGIAGIGTLAVLEVQQRLPSVQKALPAAAVAPDQQAALSETAFTPDSETDFDRLLSGTDDPAAAYAFSEPAAHEPANVPPAAEPPLQMDGLQASDAAASNSKVNAPGAIQTASFQRDSLFSDDNSAAASGSGQATGQGQADPEIPVLGSPATPGFDTPPVNGRARPAGNSTATPNLMFFGDNGSKTPGAISPGASSGATSAPPAGQFEGTIAVPSLDEPGGNRSPDVAPASLNNDPGGARSAAIPAGSSTQQGDFFSEEPPAATGNPVTIPGRFDNEASPAFPPLDAPIAPAVNTVPGNGNALDDPFNGVPFQPEPGNPASSGAEPSPAIPSGNNSIPPFENDRNSFEPANTPPPSSTNRPGSAGESSFFEPDASGAGNPGSGRDIGGRTPSTPTTPGTPELGGSNGDFPSLDLPFPDPADNPTRPRTPVGNPPESDFPGLPEGNPGRTSPRPRETPPPADEPFSPDLPDPPSTRPFPGSTVPDLNPASDPLSRDFPPRTPIDPGLPAPITPTGPEMTTGTLRPHVSIRKNAPETASVGVPLDYTILVQNEGQSPAYDVVIEDQLGRGINLVTTRPTADFDRTTGKMTWQIAELQPSEKQEILVRVTPTSEGTMDGVATVRFKAQVKATTVITAPRLSLQLTGPTEARLGDEVSFRYVVRNDGSGEAKDVILRSVLPESLKHSEGRDLEYEIESLASNEEREINLTVVAAEPGSFRNTAEITSAGVETATAQAEIHIVGAQLKVERLGPERRYVGKAAQFQNIITNETNFEATDAVVQERVPEGMKFVSAPSGEYNPQTRLITWKLDRIAPGKQVLLDVELLPEAAGQLDAIVEVVENAGFRSRATRVVAIEDLHNVSADISRMDGPVAIGEKFTFTITLDNRGTATANEVQLTVQVPAQIKILAAGSKEQGIAARLGQGNTVVYNPVVKVAPDELKTFQLVLQGQEAVRNGVVKAQLKYAEMQEPLVVSESVTVYSDSL